MADSLQFGFQDASSPIMEELIHFHDHALMAVFLICSVVLHLIITLMTTSLSTTNTIDAQEIEMIWTIMPALILIVIALPSLRILYLMEEINDPDITVKVIGHQWYWSYEYSDLFDLEFDSYMTATLNLMPGHFRLLEVDNRLVTMTGATMRMLLTAEDVLHSWAVPTLGVKTDAIPGRLSQTSFLTSKPGLFYGQCSEICGANHSFMPIVVESVPANEFLNWSKSA